MAPTHLPGDSAQEQVLQRTGQWLERAVIGLGLCPFAKAVHVKGQIRYVVSQATSPDELLDQLRDELHRLQTTAATQIDTTLLIHPHVLQDFLDYNDFLDDADGLIEQMGLEGELQIASFHPHYQFAGTSPEDITNHTNRAPYPILHLLREASVERAVSTYPEPDAIIERNMRTLRALGHSGWRDLMGDALPLPDPDS